MKNVIAKKQKGPDFMEHSVLLLILLPIAITTLQQRKSH